MGNGSSMSDTSPTETPTASTSTRRDSYVSGIDMKPPAHEKRRSTLTTSFKSAMRNVSDTGRRTSQVITLTKPHMADPDTDETDVDSSLSDCATRLAMATADGNINGSSSSLSHRLLCSRSDGASAMKRNPETVVFRRRKSVSFLLQEDNDKQQLKIDVDKAVTPTTRVEDQDVSLQSLSSQQSRPISAKPMSKQHDRRGPTKAIKKQDDITNSWQLVSVEDIE